MIDRARNPFRDLIVWTAALATVVALSLVGVVHAAEWLYHWLCP